MDWLVALRSLPDDAVRVEHRPLTLRYVRAAAKMDYIRRTAAYLGSRASENPDTVEIATWSPPGHGHGAGFYCCFRLFLDAGDVVQAVLWCCHDGKEDSVALKSLDEATAYAHSHNFREETDGTPD